jgi:hypothetical protein
MFRNISIFTILLLVSLSTSNAQLMNKKEFRLKDSNTGLIELSKPIEPISKSIIAKNKSPLLAGTLSLIVPGAALGQLYNGQYLNFGIRIGISSISIIWLVESGFFNFASDVKGNDAWWPLSLIYIANWVTSVVDAVIYDLNNSSGK